MSSNLTLSANKSPTGYGRGFILVKVRNPKNDRCVTGKLLEFDKYQHFVYDMQSKEGWDDGTSTAEIF